tara:strand:- start:5910 stop:6617 length:708 start_codon:yes stop_codon:yes gene_type:complete
MLQKTIAIERKLIMVGVPLPKGDFIPHPAGQHEGTIFDVEVRLNEATQYGPKNRVILKIESDTKMNDDNGDPLLNDEGLERGYVIWDWLTVARKQGSRFRDRREAALGRPLSEAEAKADEMDPHKEFAGKKIAYVVKHAPGKEAGQVYANIQAMWLAGGSAEYDEDAPAGATLSKEIKSLEKQIGLNKEEVAGVRKKHIKSESLDGMSNKDADTYIKVLREQVPTEDDEDDGLPF